MHKLVVHDPNLKRCKDLVDATRSGLKRAYTSSIGEIRKHPISSTLTGVSLCLSSLVWSKCVNVNRIQHRGDVRSISDLAKSVLNMLLIPEFNPNSILQILSFYLTLKRLESVSGFDATIKMITIDALVGLLFSNFVVKRLNLADYTFNRFDFDKFSKSLVSLSCFNSPEEPILAYGVIRTKNKYFPPLLVLSDYLFTFQTSSLINSAIGIIYGLIALSTYNFLFNS
ncbi:conserved hypothetical protein [Theileria orientalis strain Shintoku]|uniref:Derlin n=1 Tax=Theileria orientalis strain Shintoku TaxID=869250 RepID=J4DNI6_THEOR|nr:conserved hypothetical protein [Theileria orientalis strain Shintoku]BAM39024.1 conserved hypothetical protein [Theileria orientalis strain Shintoku]|eukprot:XP_009689325.1 conserved hypothetical protein [Theileria orientalis strain Shintoku]